MLPEGHPWALQAWCGSTGLRQGLSLPSWWAPQGFPRQASRCRWHHPAHVLGQLPRGLWVPSAEAVLIILPALCDTALRTECWLHLRDDYGSHLRYPPTHGHICLLLLCIPVVHLRHCNQLVIVCGSLPRLLSASRGQAEPCLLPWGHLCFIHLSGLRAVSETLRFPALW